MPPAAARLARPDPAGDRLLIGIAGVKPRVDDLQVNRREAGGVGRKEVEAHGRATLRRDGGGGEAASSGWRDPSPARLDRFRLLVTDEPLIRGAGDSSEQGVLRTSGDMGPNSLNRAAWTAIIMTTPVRSFLTHGKGKAPWFLENVRPTGSRFGLGCWPRRMPKAFRCGSLGLGCGSPPAGPMQTRPTRSTCRNGECPGHAYHGYCKHRAALAAKLGFLQLVPRSERSSVNGLAVSRGSEARGTAPMAQPEDGRAAA